MTDIIQFRIPGYAGFRINVSAAYEAMGWPDDANTVTLAHGIAVGIAVGCGLPVTWHWTDHPNPKYPCGVDEDTVRYFTERHPEDN